MAFVGVPTRRWSAAVFAFGLASVALGMREIALSAYVGKTISTISLGGSSLPGSWHLYVTDVVLVSADGTARPIYTRQSSVALTSCNPGESPACEAQTHRPQC